VFSSFIFTCTFIVQVIYLLYIFLEFFGKIVMEQKLQISLHPLQLDDTLSEYLEMIFHGGNKGDILESVPPILLESGCATTEAAAKELCISIMKSVGLILSEEEVKDIKFDKVQPQPQLLKVLPQTVSLQTVLPPVQLQETQKRQLNFGNTYEVENIGATPVNDDQEACINLGTFLELTKHEDPIIRKKALRELCPCHVKHDVQEFWERIFAMTNDPDATVRYQVLHNMCDGSPKEREDTVIQALEGMHNDEDKYIRRRVHQVLSNYRRTGKWNIL